MDSERLIVLEEALLEIAGLASALGEFSGDPAVARVAEDIYKTAHLALTESPRELDSCLDCA